MPVDRVFTLRERVPREVRLASNDVDYLLAHHRTHLHLQPLGNNRYRITTRTHVGTLLTPRCRFEIRPKLPIQNLLWMLGGDMRLSPNNEPNELTRGRILKVLVLRFIQLLERVVGEGVRPAYVQIDEAARYLQGRLDIPGQLREHAFRRDKLQCEVSRLTLDTPANQIPKATIEMLSASGLLDDEDTIRLSSLARNYCAVSEAPLEPRLFIQARRSQLRLSERELLDLCELLLRSFQQGGENFECPSCLVNLEQVFEAYCSRKIAEAFRPSERHDFQARLQETYSVEGEKSETPPCVYRPDVVIHDDHEPLGAIDMKWKVPPYPQTDIYQAVSYAAMLPCRVTALVYPGGPNKVSTYRFRGGEITLRIYRLRVSGDADSVSRSMELFLRHLVRIKK